MKHEHSQRIPRELANNKQKMQTIKRLSVIFH